MQQQVQELEAKTAQLELVHEAVTNMLQQMQELEARIPQLVHEAVTNMQGQLPLEQLEQKMTGLVVCERIADRIAERMAEEAAAAAEQYEQARAEEERRPVMADTTGGM
jgi:uncharacterized protein YoxC